MIVRGLAAQHKSEPAVAVAVGPAKLNRFRPDIEGMRAAAVGLVVADHLFGWPTGGFVGVDVFFVISGFLITGLISSEYQRTGRISFAGFYRRRTRRIIPIATLVLVVSIAAAFLIYRTGRAQGIAEDGLFAFIFLANWKFALDGTDYMQAAGPVSPLQHYWSLSVEEQFYLVWPWLLLAILMLGAKRSWRGHQNFVPAIFTLSLISVISFAWSIYETKTNQTWSYFSTTSRTWELGVGAILALVASRLPQMGTWLRASLAWVGIVAIGASALMLNSQSAFPGPTAAVPVLATALIIIAGCRGDHRGIWPLSNPVSRYIGKISFSLYLWHFPVAIFVASVMTEGTPLYLGVCLGGMFVLSVLSFHFLEDPIRRSQWLEPKADPQRSSRLSITGGLKVSAVAVTTVVAIVTTFLALKVPIAVIVVGAQTEASAVVPPGTSAVPTSDPAANTSDPLAQRSAAIIAALAAPDWPDLTPSLDELGPDSWVPEWAVDGCGTVTSEDLGKCSYGTTEATRTAVLIGDSVAVSWAPGIRAALGTDWRLQVLTKQACPAATVSVLPITDSADFTKACDENHQWVIDQITQIKPDLIILSSTEASMDRLASKAEGDVADSEWQVGMSDLLGRVGDLAARTVLLEPPPLGQNLESCATLLSVPADCTRQPTKTRARMIAADAAAVADTAQKTIVQVDTTPWFCTDQGDCPSFVGNHPVFADGQHLTGPASTDLSAVLRTVLIGLEAN